VEHHSDVTPFTISFNLHPYFAPVMEHIVAHLTTGGRLLQGISQERPHFLQNEPNQTKTKQQKTQTKMKPWLFFKSKFWMGPSVCLDQLSPPGYYKLHFKSIQF